MSDACVLGTCAAPTSTDGRKNGTETDIDCGGASAPKCAGGKACVAASDCEALVCAAQKCVSRPTSSGMLLWLRADTGVTLVDGKVSVWADQSGKGYDVTQTQVDARPTVTSGAQNGLPAVTFDGVKQSLDFPTTSTLTAYSVFTVYKLPVALSYAGSYYPYCFGGPANVAGNYTGIEIGGAGGASADLFDVFGGFSQDARASLTGIAASGPSTPYRLVSITSPSSATTKVWVEGTAAAMSTTGPDVAWSFKLGNGAANPFSSIGNCTGGGGPNTLAVQHGEMLVYDAVLSDAERQKVEGYLARRWGLLSSLPAGHPYKVTAP